MSTQPGKNPKTGEPQGTLHKGQPPGCAKTGVKKGKPPQHSDETKAYAAFLIADKRSAAETAEKCEISERTLWTWRKDPAFLEMVAEAMEKIKSEGLNRGYSERVARVEALNDLANGIQTVFRERAQERSHALVPGWTTGLLTHEQKSIGAGPLATVIDQYRIDVGATKEFRETIKQIAIEEGQWTEKTETTVDMSKLSDEELAELKKLRAKLDSNA